MFQAQTEKIPTTCNEMLKNINELICFREKRRAHSCHVALGETVHFLSVIQNRFIDRLSDAPEDLTDTKVSLTAKHKK